MKYFITFLLLVFAPSSIPNTAFAATNPIHAVQGWTILPHKKLSFKEKLLLKFFKNGEDKEKLDKANGFLLIGLLLLILTVVLFVVSDNKSKAEAARQAASPATYFSLNTAGIEEALGGCLTLIGSLLFLLSGYSKRRKLAKAAKKAS